MIRYPVMNTPNRAALSVAGLYEWDDRLFDLMEVPDGVNIPLVKYCILMECAELNVLYPDWDFMYDAIGVWSIKEKPTWEKVYRLSQLEYNPIENYDRIENEIELEKTEDHRLRSGSSSSSSTNMNQNNVTNKVAGANTNELAEQSGTSNNTAASGRADGRSNESDQLASNTDRNRASRIHGNIGVSTPADMMEKELSIYPKINIVDYIVRSFKERFCIMVY